VPVFKDIDPTCLEGLLTCINARRVEFKKGEFIIEAGEPTHEFGILLEGSARSIKYDESGKLTIITMIERGGAIGVLLAAKHGKTSPLAVQATENAVVLMIPFARLVRPCEKNCLRHKQLLLNYIELIAEKGLELHERINCLLEPTVRTKIMSYLTRVAREQKSQKIILPFNRNIMAEYLNIERSALSRELSRMKKDGLIEYCKNKFEIIVSQHNFAQGEALKAKLC